MATTENTNGGVTPPASVTEQPVNTEKANEEVEAPAAPTNDEQNFDDKAKRTITAIRGEREAEKAARVAAEQKAQQLENELRQLREKENEEKGNYRELWQAKAQEVSEVTTTKNTLEKELDNLRLTTKQREELLTGAVNKMIDSNLATWPEKARKLVDSAEDVSADTRLSQYLKARDLVSDLLKEAPNPGLAPSPQDIRETGDKKQVDIREKLNSMKQSGIYR